MQNRLAILVVEDDPAQREAYAELLRLDGHEVTAVNDGQAALEYAAMNHYDLVLSDLLMPCMTGDELRNQLNARGCAPKRFMLMSATVESAIRDSGVTDLFCLHKPFHPDELSRVVAECAASLAV